MAHLKNLDDSADFGTVSDWTFVYAIAIDKPGPLAESLYFFSKVNLMNHARKIDSRGSGSPRPRSRWPDGYPSSGGR